MSDSEQFRPAEERVEALVAACLERAPDEPETVVDEVCSDDPELTDEVRESLAALAALGLGFDERARDGLPLRLGGFRLVRPLGAGAMGVVYLAEDQAHQREVALKILRPELLYFPRAQERFRREMRIVSSLEHPGIVRVHTHGETDGLPWIAMERVPGASLERVLSELSEVPVEQRVGSDLVRVTRSLSGDGAAFSKGEHPHLLTSWTRAVLHVVRELALALAHAHARGVVHRDVKPSNTLFTPDGRVLLFDFGLATDDRGGHALTRTGAALGSEAYMAPEVLGGEARADERSDVYALGVMLYELLVGERPYLAEGRAGFRRRVLEGRTPSARKHGAGVSQDADVVCHVALARDPARRYPSAQALADDLARVLEHQPIRARRPGPVARTLAWMRRRPLVTAAGMVAVAALATAVALWQDNQRMETEVDATAAQIDTFFRINDNVLAAIEPFRFGQHDPPASVMLEKYLEEYEAQSYSPEHLARVRHGTARYMFQLGRLERSEELCRAALAGFQESAPLDLDSQAAVVVDLARTLIGLDENMTARLMLNDWLDLTAAPADVRSAVRADLLLLRAELDFSKSRNRALGLLAEAEGLLEARSDLVRLVSLHSLRARTFEFQREMALAEQEHARARHLLEIVGSAPELVLDVALGGASIDEGHGRWRKGLERLDQALASLHDVVEAQHPLLVPLLESRGRMLRWSGRPAEALEVFRQVDLSIASAGVEGRAVPHLLMALCAAEAGLVDEGVEHARQSVTMAAAAGKTRLERDCRHALARVLHYGGRFAEAEPAYRAASAAYVPTDTRGVAVREWIHANLSLVLRELGRDAEADELLERAEARLEALLAEVLLTEPSVRRDVRVEHVRSVWASVAWLRGRPQRAAELFAEAALSLAQRHGEQHWFAAHARGRVGAAQLAAGRPDLAEGPLRRAWEAARDHSGPTAWRTREMAHALARLHDASGREAEAEALRASAGPLRVLVYAPWN